MLDTVLEIGRVLRASSNGLKHHRYIKKAPIYDDKKNPVKFWRIPVYSDGSFDFSKREVLRDENRQKKLFYLNYKQSDADSTKPYIFGDIYRTLIKTGEDGNFRFGDPNKKSWMALNSFQRGENSNPLHTVRVREFRKSFKQQNDEIETFLRSNANVYINFDFAGQNWHELEELIILNTSLLSTFFTQTEHGYTVNAALYKTLASGSTRNSNFLDENQYKNRVFQNADQAIDLIYGINFASRSAVRVFDIKVVVLPRGDNLNAIQIERFFDRNASNEPDDSDENAEKEIRDEAGRSNSTEDNLFSFLSGDDDQSDSIVQFDFIFSRAGGTKADIDLIELSGLERSRLSHISQRLRKVRQDIEISRRVHWLKIMRGKEMKKEFPSLRILASFLNILSNKTRSEKKYQNHLLKVLPQIYTENYFKDQILLPAFIEKTEFNLRSDEPNFNVLKFDFYFLTKIQNYEGDRLMEIQNSSSYQAGILLGHLARGLRPKIKSFDKNYAGLLSRRIATIGDVIKLQNEINQKLIMHYRTGWYYTFSNDLSQLIKAFKGRYDKNECAFGFFESYFAPFTHGEDDDITIDTKEEHELQN